MRKTSGKPFHVFWPVLVLLLISSGFMFNAMPQARAGVESLSGAIWTSDPHGERVNGNLYTNPRNVYLTGGPHKLGAAGLPDGTYYFQVTDPAGKTLLSTDHISKRRFEVMNGYVSSIDGGTHNFNLDTTRGYGIVVQLWPFAFTPNKGGEYKVWVTMVASYSAGQGTFGFISSLSKTDNFKVKLDEAPKYFELRVTDGVSAPLDVSFFVRYAVDGDGDPSTFDPVSLWNTGQLIFDIHEGAHDVFRYETSFALGTYIYWQFFITNSFDWTSDMQGPELIDRAGIVNSLTLFKVNGHKYNYMDGSGLQGWTIELYRDGLKIAETHTDSSGFYEFIGLVPGVYNVSEITRTDDGWAPHGPTFYQFNTADSNGSDQTFDFYNYKMLVLTDTSDSRYELSTFHPVFTPIQDGSGLYKLSSTNPGSFYTNAFKYGTAGNPVRVEISLPPDQENAPYDSPNFILHHTTIGATSTVDVHVYSGRQISVNGSEWVPDWSKDVTNQFSITPSVDGKHVSINGTMPESGMVLVTVHIDYQIEASLTWEQVQSFNNFTYTFATEVYHSIIGVTKKISCR